MTGPTNWGGGDDEPADDPDDEPKPDNDVAYPSRRAAQIVSNERDSHGDAYENHRQIAALWNAFLEPREPIKAWEAAVMVAQIKMSRMQAGYLDEDHFVDIAGYANVAYYCAMRDPEVSIKHNDDG